MVERLFRNGYPFSIFQVQAEVQAEVQEGGGKRKKNKSKASLVPSLAEPSPSPPPRLPRKIPKSPFKKKKGTRYVSTIPSMKNILGELQKTYI